MGVSRSIIMIIGIGLLNPISAAAADDVGSVDQPNEAHLSVSVGYGHLQLPDVKLTLLMDSSENTVEKFEDHDGSFEGARIEGSLDRFSIPGLRDDIYFGISGFYSGFDDAQSGFCQRATNNWCGWAPLVDTDPNTDEKNVTSDTASTAEREVQHWGVALEANYAEPLIRRTEWLTGNTSWAFRTGIAFKAIEQALSLDAWEVADTTTEILDYRETLDTHYWGGYMGVSAESQLLNAVNLTLDAQMGLYHARSDYKGVFDSFDGGGGGELTQTVSLDKSEPAINAMIRVGAQKAVGRLKVSLFGEGEWYSYAPEMHYNDRDVESGGFVQNGVFTETHIAEADAYAFTAGGRISILLGDQ